MSPTLHNEQTGVKIRPEDVVRTICVSSREDTEIQEELERHIYCTEQEAQAIRIFELHKSLVHPAIRRPLFMEELEQNGESKLALAYRPVAKESLAQVLIHTKHFLLPDIRRVFRSVLDALEAAHTAGVHHGGIQPKHFRFSIDGQEIFVDGFGAELEPGPGSPYDPSASDGELPVGTGCGPVAKDLYAVAVILFQCLAGRTPLYAQKRSATPGSFQLRSLRNIDDPDQWARLKSHIYLIPGLDAFFRRALSTSCGHRFENAAEMRTHLLSLKNRWLPCEKGNIELVAFLGRGGFGEVFRGRLANGQDVAVKRLIYARAERRFLQEAKVMQLLTSPRIVRYIDLIYPEVSGDGSYYLVMELLHGMPGALLRNRIRAARSGMPVPEALEVFANYLLGLERMHECNIVHRDIKPANLYAPRHRPADGKLFDLGIVHDSNSSMTRGVVPGTWEYKAPEFLEAGFRGSPQSDIYSLGLCLYQALTGSSALPPLRDFEGPEEAAWLDRVQRKRGPDLHKPIFREYPSIAILIRKSVCHNPRKRYPQTRAMLEDVVLALESCTGVSYHHYLETEDPVTTDTQLLTELSRSLGSEPASWTETRTVQTVHDSNFPNHAGLEIERAVATTETQDNRNTPHASDTAKPIGASRFKSTTARNFALSGTALILFFTLFSFMNKGSSPASLATSSLSVPSGLPIPSALPIPAALPIPSDLPIPAALPVVSDDTPTISSAEIPAVRQIFDQGLAAIEVPLNPSATQLAEIQSTLNQAKAEQPAWFEEADLDDLQTVLLAEENFLSRLSAMPNPATPNSAKDAVALHLHIQSALDQLQGFPQRQAARLPALQNARELRDAWLEAAEMPQLRHAMDRQAIAELDQQLTTLAPLLSATSEPEDSNPDRTWPEHRTRLRQIHQELIPLRPFYVDVNEASSEELQRLDVKAKQAQSTFTIPPFVGYVDRVRTTLALEQAERLRADIRALDRHLDSPPEAFADTVLRLKKHCEELPGRVQAERSGLLTAIDEQVAANTFRSHADIAAFELPPAPHPDQLACARKYQIAPVVKTRTTDIVLRVIPPGEAQIGSVKIGSNKNESPVLRGIFTAPFYVAESETTVAQWNRVMGGDEPPELLGNLPKRHVSFKDAQTFCAALCEQEGVPLGTYGLPSEFEWEYAARAGTRSPFHNGTTALSKKEACFDWVGPVPVGGYPPNAWGLLDMHGNLAEWVDGILCDYAAFEDDRVHGSLIETKAGSQVVRGGAFDDPAGKCRVSFRESHSSINKMADTGFRIKRRIYLPQEMQPQQKHPQHPQQRQP